MPATTATATALLKEVYEGKVRDQLNDETLILSRIKRNSSGISRQGSARYVTFPIHTKRNTGIGARREMEDLPNEGNQGTEPVRIGLRYQYGKVAISGQGMELVDEDERAFVDLIDLEIERLKEDLSVDLNRQVYGWGSGRIATVSTVGSNTTATVTTGAQWLQDGMLVDVYTPANLASEGAAKASSVTINSVTDNGDGTGTIVTAAAVSWAAGDVIVRQGNINREWTGLNAIIGNTGTLYNVNSATVPVWRSVVLANGGTPRPLTENLLMTANHAVRRNGAKVSVMVTSLGLTRSYGTLLQQQRQYVNTTEFKGGYSGLAFTTDGGDIPLIGDTRAVPGTVFGISEKNIKVYQEHDWRWMNRDGSMWLRHPTKDAYSATMYQYSELGTDRRNAHFRIDDLTEPANA